MSDLNIKSTTLEKGLDLAKDFLGKLVSPTVEELGLLISDNVKHIRLKNQIKNLEKVKAIVEKKNMTLKQVNLKVLFPYLEGVAVEEDETLQDMWANLFINYIDSESNLTITVYPNVLKQLSSVEVKIILDMSKDINNEFPITNMAISRSENINGEVNNLIRLGLLDDVNSGGFMHSGLYNHFKLTGFAKDFIEACTLKEKVNNL